jgi:hypothetical protein
MFRLQIFLEGESFQTEFWERALKSALKKLGDFTLLLLDSAVRLFKLSEKV